MARFFLVGILALTLVHCTKKTLEYGLELKDTIRINLNTEPPSIDWTKAPDATSGTVVINLMDGLVSINYRDPELPLVPALATKWDSPDARVWTFTLRQGVKWTDGADFTAQQVLDGFERLLNPKTASIYAYFLFPIKNAEAYFKGTIKDFSQVGAKINGQGQVVVELEKPMSFFPYLMTHRSTNPVRRDLIEKFGEDKWTDPGHIQTLGPYKLKIWDHDKAIVLERNDGYYGEKAKTKYVLAYMINEYSTAVSLFQAGRLDFQETVPLNEIARMKQVPGFRQVSTLGTFYLGINTRKPPFNNGKVRRAFAQAIDRKQITDLLAGGMAPLSGWIPIGMFGYNANIGLNFDPAAARKLLDEAGYKDRKKFPNVLLAVNTNENNQRIMENIQQQVKKNLGLDIQLMNEEWKVYFAHLKSDTPNIYRMGWLTDYPDPDSFFTILLSGSDQNFTGWKNKTYDDLVAQGASELDRSKRKEIYDKAQRLLCEDEVPAIPIYSMVYSLLISPRLKDFPVNSMERLELKGTSIP